MPPISPPPDTSSTSRRTESPTHPPNDRNGRLNRITKCRVYSSHSLVDERAIPSISVALTLRMRPSLTRKRYSEGIWRSTRILASFASGNVNLRNPHRVVAVISARTSESYRWTA